MIEIHVNGCRLEPRQLRSFKAHLTGLLIEAPSDAGFFSYIEKDRNGYSGVLRVHSAWGHLVAFASEPTAEKLMRGLSRTVQHQLKDWKELRVSSH